MIFYDFKKAPSPRMVRIFMAEKGVHMETVQVDLMTAEQMKPEFAAKNPWLTVPMIELDDGTCISEISACNRYLEETYSEPPLLGRDAKEKAVIEMWNHHMFMEGFMAGAEALRNSALPMKGRALAGPHNFEQIPDLAARGLTRLVHFMADLDTRLGESKYVAGDSYSVADITALVVVDFAGWVKVAPQEDQINLKRWYDEVNGRPSATA